MIPTEEKQKTLADINERILSAVENCPSSPLLKYLLARIMLTRGELEKVSVFEICKNIV